MYQHHPLFEPRFSFGIAAAASDTTESQLGNWLARGQVILQADAGRERWRRRRFSLLDVVRLAVTARLAAHGCEVRRADAIASRLFADIAPPLRAAVELVPGLSASGILSLRLGALVLVIAPDGRAAVLHGAPGDTLAVLTAKGLTGDTFNGGVPLPGSEWFTAESAGLPSFAVIRLGAVAADVCRWLDADVAA